MAKDDTTAPAAREREEKTQTNRVKKIHVQEKNERRNNGDVIVVVVADVADDRKPSFLIK